MTKPLTAAERRRADRLEAEELNVLLQVTCRFWPSGVWEHKWDAWLAYWNENRANWLGPRRAFGQWLRREVDADARSTTTTPTP